MNKKQKRFYSVSLATIGVIWAVMGLWRASTDPESAKMNLIFLSIALISFYLARTFSRR